MKIEGKEMKKKMYYKKIMILFGLFLFAIVGAIGCGKKQEEYRQIQVYKIDGTVTVERQGSSMDAYDNMQLQSGDSVETIADSYVQLKLDEDKYIMLEPETKISLQATGNSIDSNTSIYLEKGAIVNQLDNALSKDSNYQITTPNSTMAVRGTTFRVKITVDEKGEIQANVAVYGGKVECNLVLPDGTITEPLLAEAGTEVLIWGDDKESEYVGTQEVNYEELKGEVLEFLETAVDKGEELSITKEELEVIKETIVSLENSSNKENNADSDKSENGEDAEEQNNETEENVKNTDTEEQQDNKKPNNGNGGGQEAKPEEPTDIEETPEGEQGPTDIVEIPDETQEPTDIEETPEGEQGPTDIEEIPEEEQKPTDIEETPKQPEPSTGTNTPSTPSSPAPSNPGGSGGSGSSGNSGSSGGSGNTGGSGNQGGEGTQKPETEEQSKRKVDIIFYESKEGPIFVSKTIETTEKTITIKKPFLQPTASGRWYQNTESDIVDAFGEVDEITLNLIEDMPEGDGKPVEGTDGTGKEPETSGENQIIIEFYWYDLPQ